MSAATSSSGPENLERVHGLPPGTFDGRFESYEREIHPDDRARVLGSIRSALTEGTPHDVEYPDRRAGRLDPLGRGQGTRGPRREWPSRPDVRHLREHHRPEVRRAGARRGARTGAGGVAASGGDRGVVGRRHREQGPERRGDVVEPRGRAALRLRGGGNDRPPDHGAHPAGPAPGGRPGPGPDPRG